MGGKTADGRCHSGEDAVDGASRSMIDIDSLPYPVVSNTYMDCVAGISSSIDLVLNEFERYKML